MLFSGPKKQERHLSAWLSVLPGSISPFTYHLLGQRFTMLGTQRLPTLSERCFSDAIIQMKPNEFSLEPEPLVQRQRQAGDVFQAGERLRRDLLPNTSTSKSACLEHPARQQSRLLARTGSACRGKDSSQEGLFVVVFCYRLSFFFLPQLLPGMILEDNLTWSLFSYPLLLKG